MSKTTKDFIKIFENQKNKSKKRLPNRYLFKALILFSIILISISYICYFFEYEFASNLLLNLSAGCITGSVLYLLSNVRNR